MIRGNYDSIVIIKNCQKIWENFKFFHKIAEIFPRKNQMVELEKIIVKFASNYMKTCPHIYMHIA